MNPTRYAIYGRQWAGAVVGPSGFDFLLNNGVPEATEVACAAVHREEFAVAWIRDESVQGTAADVFGQRLLFLDGANARPVSFGTESIKFSGDRKRRVKVAALGNGYVVSYENENAGAWELEAKSVDAVNLETLDTLSVSTEPAGFLGSAVASPSPDGAFLNAWIAVGATPKLFVQTNVGKSGVVQPLSFSGCPQGGETRVGTCVSPNPSFEVELWHRDSGLCYLAVGHAALGIPIGGALLVPDPLVTVGYVGGSITTLDYMAVDLPIPPGLTGADAWLQWIIIVPGGCTGFGAELSDAMKVTLH